MFRTKVLFGRIIPLFFESSESDRFSIIYMIRIRFFGPRELIQNGFRAGQQTVRLKGALASGNVSPIDASCCAAVSVFRISEVVWSVKTAARAGEQNRPQDPCPPWGRKHVNRGARWNNVQRDIFPEVISQQAVLLRQHPDSQLEAGTSRGRGRSGKPAMNQGYGETMRVFRHCVRSVSSWNYWVETCSSATCSYPKKARDHVFLLWILGSSNCDSHLITGGLLMAFEDIPS